MTAIVPHDMYRLGNQLGPAELFNKEIHFKDLMVDERKYVKHNLVGLYAVWTTLLLGCIIFAVYDCRLTVKINLSIENLLV